MLRRLAFLLGVVGATALGATSGPVLPDRTEPGPVAPATGCPTPPPEEVALRSSVVTEGAGVWAAAGGRLVQIWDGAPTAVDTGVSTGTVVRHVVSLEGVGTTFVEDGAGTDTVVLVSADGTVRIRQHAEAVNPALSPDGDLAWSVGSEVRVRDATSGRIVRSPVPSEGAVAFSPIFVGRGLVVALSASPTAAVPEDERLNDLWHLSPEGRWRRITSFAAGPDRWTAIRTPIPVPGGGVDFVLIRGRGSATVEPRFSLMHLQSGGVDRLAPLEREMYLAGLEGQTRLWNVPDAAAARVDLVRETADGEGLVVGCGATLMDPIDVPDPDRAVAAGSGAADPPGTTGAPEPSPTGQMGEVPALAILVGDFSTPEAADAVATTIRAAGGIAAAARTVDAAAVPNALRPGAFAVLVPLAPEADPRTALAAFRATLPAYASTSWVVTT